MAGRSLERALAVAALVLWALRFGPEPGVLVPAAVSALVSGRAGRFGGGSRSGWPEPYGGPTRPPSERVLHAENGGAFQGSGNATDPSPGSGGGGSGPVALAPSGTGATLAPPPPPFGGASGGGGTLGDIMSPAVDDADELFRDGLVTSESYSLAQTYGITNPLDRMAVTANGNLQRLFSSYYDAPVVVEVVYCRRRKAEQGDASPAVWDRRVELVMFGNTTVCTADSIVEVHNRDLEDLVESGRVGIGQIFRRFSILPEFVLSAAGPLQGGGFWRNYTLESEPVTCSIREVFCGGVWDLAGGDPTGDPAGPNGRPGA